MSLPSYQQDHIQSILNVAARLICGQGCFDYITPLLRDRLYWLHVLQRIYFKHCLFIGHYMG